MQDDQFIEEPGGEPAAEIPPSAVPPDEPEQEPAFDGEPHFSVTEELPLGTPPSRAPQYLEIAKRGLLALCVAVAGWAIPGLGHLVLRRWGRAAIGFSAVALLALVGMRMRGNVFPYHGADPFDILGFIADAGSGVFYLLSKTVEAAGPDVSRAAGDYGTRMIAAAGILNLLLLIDASEIASGQKT